MADLPALLIVEDDPVSAGFLADCLSTLAQCQVCDSLERAIALAQRHVIRGAVVDCQLSDGTALPRLGLLQDVLASPAQIWMTSAEWSSEKRRTYLASGVTGCLNKPISSSELRRQISSQWRIEQGAAALWNDQAAQARLGAGLLQVQTLRGLLLAELPAQLDTLKQARARQDAATVNAELHRLRAACGFCGAEALAAAIETWSRSKSEDSLSAVVQCAEWLLTAN